MRNLNTILILLSLQLTISMSAHAEAQEACLQLRTKNIQRFNNQTAQDIIAPLGHFDNSVAFFAGERSITTNANDAYTEFQILWSFTRGRPVELGPQNKFASGFVMSNLEKNIFAQFGRKLDAYVQANLPLPQGHAWRLDKTFRKTDGKLYLEYIVDSRSSAGQLDHIFPVAVEIDLGNLSSEPQILGHTRLSSTAHAAFIKPSETSEAHHAFIMSRLPKRKIVYMNNPAFRDSDSSRNSVLKFNVALEYKIELQKVYRRNGLALHTFVVKSYISEEDFDKHFAKLSIGFPDRFIESKIMRFHGAGNALAERLDINRNYDPSFGSPSVFMTLTYDK